MVKTALKVLMVIGIICVHSTAIAANAISLSFFTSTDHGTQWKWFTPDTQVINTIHNFKKQPTALYWEKNGSVIRVIDGKHIISFSGDGNRLADKEAITLPSLLKQEKPTALWRDTIDKKLHIATWVTIPKEQVQGQSLHLSDGSSIPIMNDPEWGWHAVTRLFKWNGNEWSLEHALATKSEASDTPGRSVLKPYWNEDGYSHTKLAASKYCASYSSIFRGRVCHDGDVDDILREAFYKYAYPNCKRHPDGSLSQVDCGVATTGFVSCEVCKFDLVHPTVEADNLHAILPAYLHDKATGHFKKVPIEEKGQIRIDHRNNYAFIETANRVIVLNLQSGEVILNTEGYNTIWNLHK